MNLTIEQCWSHLNMMAAQVERQTRLPRAKLCFLIASNMKPLFERLADDLWGMKIYSHPAIPAGHVQVAPERFSWGDPVMDRLWEELKLRVQI